MLVKLLVAMMVNTQSGLALLVSLVLFAQEAKGIVTLPLKSKQVGPSQVQNVSGRAARAEATGFNVPGTGLMRHNTDLQVSFTHVGHLCWI